MYEVFEHTADLGLRVRAGDLRGLLEEAARGLFAMVVANLEDVRPVEERIYHVAAEEPDLLLFDWLNELLYTFETERLLLAQFDVVLDPARTSDLALTATCRGEFVDRTRHRLEHEVKAITYHGLSAREQGGQWVAEVIVDI